MRILGLALLVPSVLSSYSENQQYAIDADWMDGVNMGGWLLMEPSWMYDQFNAPAENDFVLRNRRTSDDFAISTQRNHWANYIPDSALDTIRNFGITHVRIPVGYWIVERPVTGGTMYDYGFQQEGFVTGGMRHLETMLGKLKTRGIKAIIDLHAAPGGSSTCQSYAGFQVNSPYFWQSSPPTLTSVCGGGGPYHSARNNSRSWMDIGVDTIEALSNWIVGLEKNASLSGSVSGLEIINEPGLNTNGLAAAIQRFHLSAVPAAQAIFSKAGQAISVSMNFIGPNDPGMGTWTQQQISSGKFKDATIDFHNYYNWDGSLSWSQLADRVCRRGTGNYPWGQYYSARLPTFIGEWSQCTNLGNSAFTNLRDANVVNNLKVLWANQISLYHSHPLVVGHFYWALRMGSGWDPRPTAQYPNGHQAAGTSADTSTAGFGAAVWNLLELIRVGVAKPTRELAIKGVCDCNGCTGSAPSPAPARCNMESNVDFYGNDISNHQASSAQECCNSCAATNGCNAFTWHDTANPPNTCFLKTRKDNLQTMNGATSGTPA